MSDLISRQAAIDALDDVSANYTGKGQREWHPHIDFMIDAINKVPSVEPEKCDDCISRESALEILDDYAEDIESGNWGTAYSKARTSMCNLSTVEPERKTGKWISEQSWCLPKCSICGASCFGLHGFDAIKTPYCPTCGAKMEVDG